MENKRRRRSKKRRNRTSIARTIALSMLALLLVVSLGAVIFIGMLILNTDVFRPFVPASIPVLAEHESVPGWLGDLPEHVPGIISGIPEHLIQSDTEKAEEKPNSQQSDLSIFAVFPFYLPEMAEYYQLFYDENPGYDAETVVWKVNAFLHLPFYSYIRINDDVNPLLINPFHRLPDGFSPPELVPVYSGNPNLRATPATAEAFRKMQESANRAGFALAVASAYRTAARQAELFARQTQDGIVARPYHSEHQTGRALDLWGPGGLLDSSGPPSPTGIWVRENAHIYGFIIRYTEENTHITGFISEPWHITYVGIGISIYMHENNIQSLEEFVARNPDWRL